MNAEGRGVAWDDAEAVRWYRLAAEQGDADAQYSLGNMNAEGRGVARDDAEAVRWYRLAAEQGYARAQNRLGAMYGGQNPGVCCGFWEAPRPDGDQGFCPAVFPHSAILEGVLGTVLPPWKSVFEGPCCYHHQHNPGHDPGPD